MFDGTLEKRVHIVAGVVLLLALRAARFVAWARHLILQTDKCATRSNPTTAIATPDGVWVLISVTNNVFRVDVEVLPVFAT